MGKAEERNAWVCDAVVDFLRGPLYINPLMSFIDEKCLIFSQEEENRFEYTGLHEEFKELVDELLTNFLADLGLSGEEFYAFVSDAKDKDKLTGAMKESDMINQIDQSAVLKTILTVDDFIMFKSMMAKRNVDLTNQVIEAIEEAAREAALASRKKSQQVAAATTSGVVRTAEEEAALEAALKQSRSLHEETLVEDKLQSAMRQLQLEDEDVALAAALAASLKEAAAADTELADINQAIALSLALEAEQRRLAAEAAAAAEAAKKGASPRTSNGSDAISKTPSAPAAKTASAPLAGAVAPATYQVVASATPATAAAASASSLPALKSTAAAPKPASVRDINQEPLNLPPGKSKNTGNVPNASDFPVNVAGTNQFAGVQSSVRQRAAGYKDSNENSDMDRHGAVREAAKEAAETQKVLIAAKTAGLTGNAEQAKWMADQKAKLIAAKRLEREAEMEAYKAAQSSKLGFGSSSSTAAGNGLDAKRAALQDRLAQRFKQDLISKGAA